ncbi:hypothetical protein M419DRAFT_10042 [Trichoderma reesei RUT C-30]|uniref:Uncharacterized protein n=1 Tax=Hypocrea jecorina (strain ATCC 56765 / BCRC 32924 / NRRL 11460 / Rut C-30) TaxID=1344414 RepID=A0A024S5V7_HYPJR|nr:hypothetical protein M419DRAFT_10042 [Trichoderma reesei RUT C-30]
MIIYTATIPPRSDADNGTVAIAISQPPPVCIALAPAIRRLSIASRPPPALRFALSVALSVQI